VRRGRLAATFISALVVGGCGQAASAQPNASTLKLTAKQAVAQGAIRAVRIGEIDNPNTMPTVAQVTAEARWVAVQPHTIKLLHCKFATMWEVSWSAATMRHVGWSKSDIAGGTSYFTHSADGGTWGTPGC
jgi:hypothetical protein